MPPFDLTVFDHDMGLFADQQVDAGCLDRKLCLPPSTRKRLPHMPRRFITQARRTDHADAGQFDSLNIRAEIAWHQPHPLAWPRGYPPASQLWRET